MASTRILSSPLSIYSSLAAQPCPNVTQASCLRRRTNQRSRATPLAAPCVRPQEIPLRRGGGLLPRVKRSGTRGLQHLEENLRPEGAEEAHSMTQNVTKSSAKFDECGSGSCLRATPSAPRHILSSPLSIYSSLAAKPRRTVPSIARTDCTVALPSRSTSGSIQSLVQRTSAHSPAYSSVPNASPQSHPTDCLP